MIPKSYRKDVKGLILEIDKALGQFIRGRLLLALYVALPLPYYYYYLKWILL